MFKEFIAFINWPAATVLVAIGITSGVISYHVVNPQPKPFKESMIRSTTITGKGQFKCQTGC